MTSFFKRLVAAAVCGIAFSALPLTGAQAATSDTPVKNVPELISYVKARPNQLAFASAGNGSNVHIFGQSFADLAGLQMAHVPYKGSAAAHVDLMAGRTQIVFDTLGAVQPH